MDDGHDHLTTDQPKNDLSIFLLGKTGSGKSRTGNSILGKPSAFRFDIQTDKCSVQTIENRFGKNINVIDTTADPLKENEIKEKMNHFKESSTSIYIFCIQIGRFNDSDYLAYKNYEKCLGKGIFNSDVVLFTCFDKWENDMKDSQREKYEFEDYIKSLSQQNKTLLKLCRDRWVYFNNRLGGQDNDSQVKNLFEKIEDIMKPSKSWFSLIRKYIFPALRFASTRPNNLPKNQEKKGVKTRMQTET